MSYIIKHRRTVGRTFALDFQRIYTLISLRIQPYPINISWVHSQLSISSLRLPSPSPQNLSNAYQNHLRNSASTPKPNYLCLSNPQINRPRSPPPRDSILNPQPRHRGKQRRSKLSLQSRHHQLSKQRRASSQLHLHARRHQCSK